MLARFWNRCPRKQSNKYHEVHRKPQTYKGKMDVEKLEILKLDSDEVEKWEIYEETSEALTFCKDL